MPRCALCLLGKKVAEDAQLTRDDLPALYTLSRDGALFSWTYDNSEEVSHPRKKQRRAPSAEAKNTEALQRDAVKDQTEGAQEQFAGMKPPSN